MCFILRGGLANKCIDDLKLLDVNNGTQRAIVYLPMFDIQKYDLQQKSREDISGA